MNLTPIHQLGHFLQATPRVVASLARNEAAGNLARSGYTALTESLSGWLFGTDAQRAQTLVDKSIESKTPILDLSAFRIDRLPPNAAEKAGGQFKVICVPKTIDLKLARAEVAGQCSVFHRDDDPQEMSAFVDTLVANCPSLTTTAVLLNAATTFDTCLDLASLDVRGVTPELLDHNCLAKVRKLYLTADQVSLLPDAWSHRIKPPIIEVDGTEYRSMLPREIRTLVSPERASRTSEPDLHRNRLDDWASRSGRNAIRPSMLFGVWGSPQSGQPIESKQVGSGGFFQRWAPSLSSWLSPGVQVKD